MSSLLARQAENIFWMARQIERINNLARILDVNAAFNRNSDGEQHWDVILGLFDDGARIVERYDDTSAASVLAFYILDTHNPNSIVSTLYAARENARALRPLISTEMWMQLNVFYNDIRKTGPEEISESRLSALCHRLKESCQTHTGITLETLYRDEAWYFYCLGECIERADQVTRLVDVKYQSLLPSPYDVGSAVDVSQWNALLRSAAGFHAYRRVHNFGMTPESIADFLLFNPNFPRSLARSVSRAERQLSNLQTKFNIQKKHSATLAHELVSRVSEDSIDTVIKAGMHQYMDSTQIALAELTTTISNEYFGATDEFQ